MRHLQHNVQNFTHGMFQSVYDYPYLSSSANHIFDITLGYSTGSALSSSSNTQNTKKISEWREQQAYEKTKEKRPDLLDDD